MKQLKTCVYLLFALSFITFIFTFLVFSRRENEKAKRLEAEAQLKVLKDEKERLILAYEDAKTAREEAETELKKELRRAQELEQQVVIEKREKENLAGQIATLQGDLERVSQEYKASQGKYERLAKIAKRLKVRFAELKGEPSPPHSIELPTLVVNPTQESEGRVLVINDAFRFVVVNIGEEQGLRMGSTLRVLRDSGEIGKVQVEKLYDRMSACAIVSQDDQNPIQVHDMVKTT